ncbi:MAG TPA: DUF1232 domain-containing protein [Thermomicrobiales bacterium]|nr:DUF1232 domain-containing protein [Thermomicrobiales bacterium]
MASGKTRINLGAFDRLRLGWRLLRDPRVPSWPKLLVPALTVLYVLSPVDLMPDFLPVLGQLDDVGVIALALAMVAMLARWSPAAIVAEHAAALGLGGYADDARRAGRRGRDGRKGRDEPIEATYWVDDWE